ncbi:hypothetical protein BMS3Abin04_00304 [bacterium BMS3Abin04]|nr:hypothetical protein BMS3Abin04_00304 [bacterium BMS3Abin04]
MEFEWDQAKNKRNISKHNIDFRDAVLIFNNPILIKMDTRKDYKEIRWIGLGILEKIVVVVVFTKRKDKIRIISIRKANKKERMIYYEQTNLF